MFNLPYDAALAGVIIFLRISGIFFTLPVIGDEPTPVRARILLAASLAFIIYPIIMPQWITEIPSNFLTLGLVLFKELLVGLVIGFISRLFFDGIIMAASIVGYQMGFGTANLLVPDANIQMNSFTALHRIVLMLVFLSLDLHHMYIEAMVYSFKAIPCGLAVNHVSIGNLMIQATTAVFIVAVQLSSPVLVALMFTMAALGLIARTVPQINIFTMSFPTSFFIGLLIYVASLPYFPQMIRLKFEENYSQIMSSLSWLSP